MTNLLKEFQAVTDKGKLAHVRIGKKTASSGIKYEDTKEPVKSGDLCYRLTTPSDERLYFMTLNSAMSYAQEHDIDYKLMQLIPY